MKPKDKLKQYIEEFQEFKKLQIVSGDFDKYREDYLGSWLFLSKECGFATTAETRRIAQYLLEKTN